MLMVIGECLFAHCQRPPPDSLGLIIPAELPMENSQAVQGGSRIRVFWSVAPLGYAQGSAVQGFRICILAQYRVQHAQIVEGRGSVRVVRAEDLLSQAEGTCLHGFGITVFPPGEVRGR